MSAIQKLKGSEIQDIKSEISTTHSIDALGADFLLEIPLELLFSEYVLKIYNPIKLKGPKGNFQLAYLKGFLVGEIHELKNSVILELTKDNLFFEFLIDLRDESYTGPEAMCLFGPKDLIVVWD